MIRAGGRGKRNKRNNVVNLFPFHDSYVVLGEATFS